METLYGLNVTSTWANFLTFWQTWLEKMTPLKTPFIHFPKKMAEFGASLNSLKKIEKRACYNCNTVDIDNIVTTDGSTTGLGITLWQKPDDGNTKPIAHGSRYLDDTEKKYSIGELELMVVVWGVQQF